MKKEFNFLSSDGITDIYCALWEVSEPKGIIQIAYGISEYLDRYDEFAKFFNDLGYIVVGNDYIGHGKSINPDKGKMYFGADESYNYLIDDMYTLYKKVSGQYNNIPYYMLGFSLGTFIARCLCYRKDININGLILMGTSQNSSFEIKLGKYMCNRELRTNNDKAVTKAINDLAINSHNKKFKNTRTCMDWLCSNEEAIDSYLNDSMISKDYTIGIFRELLNSMEDAIKNIDLMKKDIRVLILSGKNDPVGNFGKGVIKTYKAFKKCKFKDVQMKLYDSARHDLFRERNNIEVYNDMLEFMKNI